MAIGEIFSMPVSQLKKRLLIIEKNEKIAKIYSCRFYRVFGQTLFIYDIIFDTD